MQRPSRLRSARHCAARHRAARAFLGLAVWLAGGGDASAFPLKSQYTTIELKTCKLIKRHADGNAHRCPGLVGYPVYVAEGDLRAFVAAGADGATRRAGTQTLPTFNSIFRDTGRRATMEWRVTEVGNALKPHATILRYYTEREGQRGQVLVVSKVSATETCQIAWIDALANVDAIELARKIADAEGRSFDCKMDPRIEGATGKSPM
jgi:hypothetical protein